MQNNLTEEEIILVHEIYNSGLTDATSIVSKLYARGNDMPFTLLKKLVKNELNIKDVYKSISSSLNDEVTTIVE